MAALDGSGFLAANPGWLDRWIDHVEQAYDLTGMARLVAAINRRPDYTPTTSRIDVPATVIHGTDDSVLLGFGRRLAGLIASADFVEVEGAGHPPDGAARAGDRSDPRPGGESERRRSIALP